MKKLNSCIKEDFVPIDNAIRLILGIKMDEVIPADQHFKFDLIMLRATDPIETGDWYFLVNKEKWPVRYEKCGSQDEIIVCVNLVDFKNWHEHYESKLARIRILSELLRLESHAVEVFLELGYDGVVNKGGLFQSGSEYDKDKFIIFARKVDSNENATKNDVVAARIALALPELWADYRSSSPNPWILSSRLLVYGSAIPDPQGTERLLAVRESEIEGMLPDYERGKKVLGGVLHAHEIAHGTKEEKEKRWRAYFEKCMQAKSEKPHWNLTAVRKKVADDEGVSLKTIERHTRELVLIFKELDK